MNYIETVTKALEANALDVTAARREAARILAAGTPKKVPAILKEIEILRDRKTVSRTLDLFVRLGLAFETKEGYRAATGAPVLVLVAPGGTRHQPLPAELVDAFSRVAPGVKVQRVEVICR